MVRSNSRATATSASAVDQKWRGSIRNETAAAAPSAKVALIVAATNAATPN